ncbi:MAG: RNA polymerase sigma factor [Bacteroidota bacterium]
MTDGLYFVTSRPKLSMDFAITLENAEKDFVAALVRQERWAQKQLYEQYFGKLMGICMRYAGSRDEALDLLHEGFMKAFQHIGKYKPGTSIFSWLRTLMVNVCIDYYRKNQRRRTSDLDTVVSKVVDGPDVLSSLTEEEILSKVQELPPVYRTVFNLYVIEGYSHKEIGEMLDITESTSRSNLVKARQKLIDSLSGTGYQHTMTLSNKNEQSSLTDQP